MFGRIDGAPPSASSNQWRSAAGIHRLAAQSSSQHLQWPFNPATSSPRAGASAVSPERVAGKATVRNDSSTRNKGDIFFPRPSPSARPTDCGYSKPALGTSPPTLVTSKKLSPRVGVPQRVSSLEMIKSASAQELLRSPRSLDFGDVARSKFGEDLPRSCSRTSLRTESSGPQASTSADTPREQRSARLSQSSTSGASYASNPFSAELFMRQVYPRGLDTVDWVPILHSSSPRSGSRDRQGRLRAGDVLARVRRETRSRSSSIETNAAESARNTSPDRQRHAKPPPRCGSAVASTLTDTRGPPTKV